MNAPEEFAEVERQLRRLEPPPPELDRLTLMYRAGWAAARAQQPARRWAWMAPAAGGFLTAAASGLLAVAMWRSTGGDPPSDRPSNGIAQTSAEPVEHAEPAVEVRVPEANDSPSGERGVRDVATAPPVPLDKAPHRSRQFNEDQPIAARPPAAARTNPDAWAIVSTALAERHGVRWDEPWQRGAEGRSSMDRSPPPTVMQMMREVGIWPEYRGG